MKRLISALVVLVVLTFGTVASAAPTKIIPNDPTQNPLMASGTISAGLSDTLDSSVRLKVTVSNPTLAPVTFNLAKAIFVQGTQEKGHPLYAEQLDVAPIAPGSIAELRFRFPNPQGCKQVSAYVLLAFVSDGKPQGTALFIAGPKQRDLADHWQKTFFPYGHFTGFVSTTEYVQAPFWGGWNDFSPFWW